MIVPEELTVRGPRPAGAEACSACGQRKSAHSGHTCVICGGPVEHHKDQQQMQVEIEGRARMARARQAAGAELDDADRYCLRAAVL